MPALAWNLLMEQKALENFSLSFLMAARLFSLLWWLQGAVEEGLGLTSAIITALLHSGMPRSVSIGGRDGLCVRPLSRQCTGTLPSATRGYLTRILPLCPVPICILLCTHQGCFPSPYTLPATGVLSFVS